MIYVKYTSNVMKKSKWDGGVPPKVELNLKPNPCLVTGCQLVSRREREGFVKQHYELNILSLIHGKQQRVVSFLSFPGTLK